MLKNGNHIILSGRNILVVFFMGKKLQENVKCMRERQDSHIQSDVYL